MERHLQLVALQAGQLEFQRRPVLVGLLLHHDRHLNAGNGSEPLVKFLQAGDTLGALRILRLRCPTGIAACREPDALNESRLGVDLFGLLDCNLDAAAARQLVDQSRGQLSGRVEPGVAHFAVVFGCAGMEGDAVSLVCIDEATLLSDIETLLREPIRREVVPGFDLFRGIDTHKFPEGAVLHIGRNLPHSGAGSARPEIHRSGVREAVNHASMKVASSSVPGKGIFTPSVKTRRPPR